MDDPNHRTVDSAADMELDPRPPKPAARSPLGASTLPEAEEGPEVEQSKGSFNAKGDSAKTLSAFPDAKAPPADPSTLPPVPS